MWPRARPRTPLPTVWVGAGPPRPALTIYDGRRRDPVSEKTGVNVDGEGAGGIPAELPAALVEVPSPVTWLGPDEGGGFGRALLLPGGGLLAGGGKLA